jgi:hypothetical protein
MVKKKFLEWCQKQQQDAFEKRNSAETGERIDYWHLRMEFFEEIIKKFISTKGERNANKKNL